MRCCLHQKIGKLAVIGEQEQTLAGIVKAAHGIDARADAVKQVHDRGAVFRIVQCGDVAFGLVHQQIDMPFRAVEKLAVHADVIDIGIGFAAQLGDDLSIYRDESSANNLLGLAARSNSGSSDNFL